MSDSYDVGYGKPPREFQFAKGQSGNPKGRPKGTRNQATIFREITRGLIAVKENGQTRYVTRIEAALMQLGNKAAAGEFRSIKELLLYDRMFEAAEEQQPEDGPDHEKDRAVMQRMLERIQNIRATDSETEDV